MFTMPLKDKYVSQSILNILATISDNKEYVEKFRKFADEQSNVYTIMQPKSSLEFHKYKLGKQSYCFTNGYRYWVWETPDWRVYVSKRGFSFEVHENLDVASALLAWQQYYEKVSK